jgi:hypothetical protein
MKFLNNNLGVVLGMKLLLLDQVSNMQNFQENFGLGIS